ncbi:ABC transporter permease [Brachybacterium sp. Z12]|uniref:ABC transporter permease n=1 Tax=Brachybacterium sp. Z12 TaxID=2759167 RepID=UPI0037BFBA0E
MLPWPSRIAVLFLAMLALLAIFAPLLAPHSPLTTGTPVEPPSAEHWLGTDAIGRDIFSRVAHGARSSLLIGLAATAGALLAAAVIGSFAATASKFFSEIVMRLLDVVMSFPGIALAAVFVAVFGTSLPVLIFATGFLYVPQLARVIRANVLSQFGKDYVAGFTGHGRLHPVDPGQARGPQLHRPDHGVRDRAGRRRDRARGLAVLHQRGRAAAEPLLGQHPGRRQAAAAVRLLVADLLPRRHR